MIFGHKFIISSKCMQMILHIFTIVFGSAFFSFTIIDRPNA